MISLMTLALIWSRFWSGEPRHKQSLFGSKCPFCTSLVPSAGSAAPSSWFTHSWVQTNSHIHPWSHTHTHGNVFCFKCIKLMRDLYVQLGAHVTNSLLYLFSPHKHENRNTPIHTGLTPGEVSGCPVQATGKTAGSACHQGRRQTRRLGLHHFNLSLLP